MNLNQRNTSLDIIRILASFSVVSIHFLRNIDFYSETIYGTEFFIMCTMRTLFSICVPLFFILTGYLTRNKKLSKTYYSGLKKTLYIYLFCSIISILFHIFYMNESYNLGRAVTKILRYEADEYSWYVELYIGLFLLTPFLNLIYQNLKSKRLRQVLLLTLIFLTILPSLINIWRFDSWQWWQTPAINDNTTKIIPDCWESLYPITYFFLGAYLCDYDIKIKTKFLVILFPLCTVLFGAFNYYRRYGILFDTKSYSSWSGFEAFLLSIFIFLMISRIPTKHLPNAIKTVLWKLADLSLTVYLISYVFDLYAYDKLNSLVGPIQDKLKYYFIIVPFVFICSVVSAFLINLCVKYFDWMVSKCYCSIRALFGKQKKELPTDSNN